MRFTRSAIGYMRSRIEFTVLEVVSHHKSLRLASPAAEQFRIAAEVDRLLSEAEASEICVTRNATRSQRLRQSILKCAFEGRLVDEDPADEPASVLLQRIRTEGAAAGDVRSRRRRRGNETRNAAKGQSS